MIDLHPHLVALRTLLEADGIPVGDHIAPLSDDGSVVAPCQVLYILPSAQPYGSIGCPDTEVLFRFQVTSIEETAEGVAYFADRAYAALTGSPLVVEDREVFRVRRTSLGRVERDTSVKPPLFYCPTPYSFMTMSAVEAS